MTDPTVSAWLRRHAQAAPGRLGRFAIDGVLGKGTMGIVYKGHDTANGRAAAIKTMTLSRELHGDDLTLARHRFAREARLAGELKHPAIVEVLEAGEEAGLAFIALELAPGRDLTPHAAPASLLPFATVLQIVATVAEALEQAHSRGIVHGDIKPANLIYAAQPSSIKITDFGIARAIDAGQTPLHPIVGTPSYMSPEQLAGRKIDGRSDLWSLGVTLFQLACGCLPFEGESMTQLMYKIANEPHLDVAYVKPALPTGFKPIIDRALAKRPEQRFQSGGEMASALHQLAKA